MADDVASGRYKLPLSVLVVIYTPALEVLLLERADHPGWWQSVTGSLHAGETPWAAAVREVAEETGLDALAYDLQDWGYSTQYEIFECYRHRYAPGTTHNTEHVFGLRLPRPLPVRLNPREHLASRWLPWAEAAAACFSPSNAEAIRRLPQRPPAALAPLVGQ
ncbi:MAG: dihydroneopterin triphosphate diphosphatase [Thiobacillaceae bacterium]|nr:dihydroneopterin triphosphate diphosphatase [Thiobacillaceae bacterium]